MATISGTNYAKLQAKDPDNYLEGVWNGANLQWIYDTVELSSATTGDVVKLGGLIPKGAVLTPFSTVLCDSLGGNVQIGTAASADAFLASSATSAGTLSFPTVGKVAQMAADTQVVMTLVSGTYTGTVEVAICYAKY